MAIDKYYLNLAGEYRVAAELLKREISQRSLTAIVRALIFTRLDAIVEPQWYEVKASNSDRFTTGFYQKYRSETVEHPDFWILYCLRAKDSETFFILTHEEWLARKRRLTMLVRA